MREIHVQTDEPAKFYEQVKESLKGSTLFDIVSFQMKPNEVVISFDKIGTSKIYYTLEKVETGYKAIRKKESIAFTHGIFKPDIERKLKLVMLKLGAKIVE